MRVMSMVICLLVGIALLSCADKEQLARLSDDVQRLETEKSELAKQLDETKTALATATAQAQSCDTAKLSCMDELGACRTTTPENLYQQAQKHFAEGQFADGQSALEQVVAKGACSKWGKRAEAELERLKQYTSNVRYVYKRDGLKLYDPNRYDWMLENPNVLKFASKVIVQESQTEVEKFLEIYTEQLEKQASKTGENQTEAESANPYVPNPPLRQVVRQGSYSPQFVLVSTEHGTGFVDGNYLLPFPCPKGKGREKNETLLLENLFGEAISQKDIKSGFEVEGNNELIVNFPLGCIYRREYGWENYRKSITIPFLKPIEALVWYQVFDAEAPPISLAMKSGEIVFIDPNTDKEKMVCKISESHIDCTDLNPDIESGFAITRTANGSLISEGAAH